MEHWQKMLRTDFEKWWDSLDKPGTFGGCNYKSTCLFAWEQLVKRYALEEEIPIAIRQNAHEDFIHNGLAEHNNETNNPNIG